MALESMTEWALENFTHEALQQTNSESALTPPELDLPEKRGKLDSACE